MTIQELNKEWDSHIEALEDKKELDYMQGAKRALMHLGSALMKSNPETVAEAIELWDSSSVHNFLTESEAIAAAQRLINASGERAPKWDPATLFGAIEQLNVEKDIEPYFNKWALFFTMNWLYSDYSEELAEAVDKDKTKFVTLIYKMAVKKLQDPDYQEWIREYLELE